MKLRSDLFPYPVLSNELDDYINSSFEVEINQEKISVNRIKLSFEYKLDNAELNSLIEEEKASFAIHIEGESSSYRKLAYLTKDEYKYSVELESKTTPKKLFVNFMVIAKEKIHNYSNKNFNKDYYGDDLVIEQIEKGSILAYDTMAELNIDFSNDDNGSLKSMIRVAEFDENYMEVDFDSDVIQINLPKKSYIAYVNLSNSSQERQKLLLVTIILPALTMAIEKIKYGEIDETVEWVVSLGYLLKKINLDIESIRDSDYNSMKIAQQLLDCPLENVLYDYYIYEEEKNE
ncbi:hypothetical protein [uncultured Gemella sp.]|uniref:hypothetical protein n=1 Tax=uncultured Gemella sp. TaxID=254352 RepID=UPI0026078ED4|nr:hypothetical protein [uncultured Gemella sp.]